MITGQWNQCFEGEGSHNLLIKLTQINIKFQIKNKNNKKYKFLNKLKLNFGY